MSLLAEMDGLEWMKTKGTAQSALVWSVSFETIQVAYEKSELRLVKS